MIIDFLKLVYHRKCFSMCLFCIVFKIYVNVILIRHASIFFPIKIDRHINRNSKVNTAYCCFWGQYDDLATQSTLITSPLRLSEYCTPREVKSSYWQKKKNGNNLAYYYMIHWLNNAKHSSSLPSLWSAEVLA